MQKLLVICGPTATGKTKLGVKLAKIFGGEIVSADSRQAYRGLDIATGKDLSAYGDIPVWMLDVVEPNEQFSVAQYFKLAHQALKDIWSRGKLPIVVGGTGLYIKALVSGIGTLHVPPNEKLRRKYENKTASELLEVLNKINPQKAKSLNESDRKNPRRLIRAIEIADWKLEVRGGKLDEEVGSEMDILMVGLTAPRAVLYQLIDARIDIRMKAGMVGEVKSLLKKGVPHKRFQSLGLEYRYIDNYLAGKIARDEMVRALKYAIHGFARRQMTWFKKDKRIKWLDIAEKGWGEKVERLVRKWYNRKIKD